MEVPRIIGEYDTGNPGPLLFVTAGVHGNEPSGVKALENVFEGLRKAAPQIKGTLVGVSGNREALKRNVRYIDRDLNRIWTPEIIENRPGDYHEESEMHAIIEVLESYRKRDYNDMYFLDCHTTSSSSLPYISVQEVGANDRWAHRFPTYIVRGFSDIITGDIDHYLSRVGLTGFVFEAGQHESEEAVENHEGIIWLALKKRMGVDLECLPGYPGCVENFTVKNSPRQKTFEICHREGLAPGDTFKMEPGFKNFDSVEKGQLLATHNGNPVKSRWDASIFMPLYQDSGNDGFFIIREVS